MNWIWFQNGHSVELNQNLHIKYNYTQHINIKWELELVKHDTHYMISDVQLIKDVISLD